MAKEGKFALLKLPSGEQRMVQAECRATVGQVGNLDYRKYFDRQGGPQPPSGLALARARGGDEPGGPSARRRRGPLQGQPSAIAVGAADQGLQDTGKKPSDRYIVSRRPRGKRG